MNIWGGELYFNKLIKLKFEYEYVWLIRFGGDLNKVILFGGLVGGICVLLLMLLLMVYGLY